MRYEPFEMLPFPTREVGPRFMGAGFDIMLAYRDVIGLTKGVIHIEEFYKGKPVVIGKPKRYKHQRN